MTLSQFFKAIGAPLKNNRWSWGALSHDRRSIFLRIYDDEIRKFDGKQYVQVTAFEKFALTSNLGWNERLDHLKKVKAGKSVYLISCVAKDVTQTPRKVKYFDADMLWEGGSLLYKEGDFWLELKDRVNVTPFLHR